MNSHDVNRYILSKLSEKDRAILSDTHIARAVAEVERHNNASHAISRALEVLRGIAIDARIGQFD